MHAQSPLTASSPCLSRPQEQRAVLDMPLVRASDLVALIVHEFASAFIARASPSRAARGGPMASRFGRIARAGGARNPDHQQQAALPGPKTQRKQRMEISIFAHGPSPPLCYSQGGMPGPHTDRGGPNAACLLDSSPMLKAGQHLVGYSQPVPRLAPAPAPVPAPVPALPGSERICGIKAPISNSTHAHTHTNKQEPEGKPCIPPWADRLALQSAKLQAVQDWPVGADSAPRLHTRARARKTRAPLSLPVENEEGRVGNVSACAAPQLCGRMPRSAASDPTAEARTTRQKKEVAPLHCRPRHVVRRLRLAWLAGRLPEAKGRRRRGLKRGKRDGMKQPDFSAPCDAYCPPRARFPRGHVGTLSPRLRGLREQRPVLLKSPVATVAVSFPAARWGKMAGPGRWSSGFS